MRSKGPFLPFSNGRRALSWLSALVLFVAIAAGTQSVLRLHAQSPSALQASALSTPAASPATESVPVVVAPSPSPRPSPNARRPAPAPAPVKVAAPARTASIVIVSAQQRLINQDRARYGLRPLSWSSCLAGIAYSNAVRMANQGYISHTNGPTRDLGCQLGYHAGENVGWYSAGPSDTWANNAFMASAGHRANILSSYYRYVGTSWVRAANGRWYIAVEFS
jgi:uncharacterized protein YkwD